MSERVYILLVHRRDMVLIRSDANQPLVRTEIPVGEAEDLADLLRPALTPLQYQDESLVVALSHPLCFALPIQCPQRRSTHEAMLYALEERLPWPAEELAADFVHSPPSAALAIVAELSPLQALLEALGELGVNVEAVTPITLLALQHILNEAGTNSPTLVVWRDEQVIHSFWLNNGKLTRWLIASDEPELHRQLRLHQGPSQPAVRAVTIGLYAEFTSVDGASSTRSLPAMSMVDAALAMVREIAAGTHSPPVDLRTGVLSPADRHQRLRPALNAVAAAAMLLLLCIAGTLVLRSGQYDRLADTQRQRQNVIYQQLYPSQAPPLDVVGRLQSEHRQLSGLAGGHDVKPPRSALSVLYAAMVSLPPDLRFRILELRIEKDKLFLDGEANSHGDAERIVTLLREKSGFKVDPPRSESRGERGVGFSIVAATQQTSVAAVKGAATQDAQAEAR